jgi:polyferredoxin
MPRYGKMRLRDSIRVFEDLLVIAEILPSPRERPKILEQPRAVYWKEKQFMQQKVSAILQTALMENEKIRRRQVIAFAGLFLAVFTSLVWIGHLAGKPATDVRELIVWSVIAVFVAICYGAMALALYINRTALRLLRTLKGISEQM